MKREINTAARWLVIAVTIAGILAAAGTLVLIWTTTPVRPLPERINDSMAMGSALLLLAVAFLIAWRAGDQPASNRHRPDASGEWKSCRRALDQTKRESDQFVPGVSESRPAGRDRAVCFC